MRGGGGDGAEDGNTGLGHLGECVCPYVAIRADSETSRRRHSGIGGDQELQRRRKEKYGDLLAKTLGDRPLWNYPFCFKG